MCSDAIPECTAQGLLPPVNSADPTSVNRSPYKVSITDLVLRYAESPEREAILQGLLQYRSRLHAIGLISGFQWIDGSFAENVELIEGRPPQDVDVVTFYHLPEGRTQNDLLQGTPRLFCPDHTKTEYHVDAYFVHLDGYAPEPLVGHTTYWYSLWAHKRDGRWKGYLQIDLSPDEDGVASAILANPSVEEVGNDTAAIQSTTCRV